MKKNIILLLAAIFLTAGLLAPDQNVFAGDPYCQGSGGSSARLPDPTPTPTPTPQRADFAAAQLKHERNLPPGGGINSVESPTGSNFTFFASIFVLIGGLWALLALLRNSFKKLRQPKHVRLTKVWNFAFKPSFTLSAFGFSFLAVIILSVGLFAPDQNVLAGDPNAQRGYITNPYNPNPPPNKPAREERELAAAQFRNAQIQPPSNSGGDLATRSGFTFFASIFVLIGGIWALFILLRQYFNKLRGKNQVRPSNIWEVMLKPSVALSAFGFLFLAAMIGSVLTEPTAVTAGKRKKPNKSLMTGAVNPADKPVFKTAQQIGGSGITQIGSPVFDAAGNRYVRGGFTGTLTIGATTLAATEDFDMFVAKYDANGTPIWARQGTGATVGVTDTLAVEGATALAVDAGGNVYIGGSFVKTLTLQGGANPSITLTDNGAAGINYESFVAKYDGAGNLLWGRGGNTNSPKNPDNLETGQNAVNRIVFDSSGNPYIAGFVSGTRFLGDTIANQGLSDIMLAKLDPASGAIVWKQIIGGTEDDNGLDLEIDGSDTLYLIGNFGSPEITFPNGDTYTNPGDPNNFEGDSTDTFIAKFDAADGANLFTENIGNDTTVGASQIAVNQAGEILITGYFFNSVTFGETTLTENEGGSGEDNEESLGGYIAKMDANGDFVWAKGFGGIGESIALDDIGRIYIAGTFFDGAQFGEDTPNAEMLASFGGVDIFIARYEANGDFGFAKAIAATGQEGTIAVGNPSAEDGETENNYNPLGIAFNPARGTIFISGDFQTAIALDCTTLTTNGANIHSYITELSADGEAVTCRIWNGLDDDDNNWESSDNWNGGIVPNDNDSVYVPYTGNSFDNPTYNPATTTFLKNLTVDADRTLTLNRDLPMEGKLSLLGGIVDAGANNKLLDLEMSSTVVRVADLDGDGGLVIGKIRKNFGNLAPFTFPVGTANGYSPVDVNPSQSAEANLTINAVAEPQPLFANSANRINRYWDLNQSGEGSLTANLTFHYLESDVVGDESQLELFKVEDGQAMRQTAAIDTTANTATVNNVSEFSDWTLAQLAPTAASVSVGGRVSTTKGYGISRAIVVITDENGNEQRTVTNSFGYFHFGEIEAGKTYVFSVRHKRYTFAPQVINVFNAIDNLNMVSGR